MKYLDEYGLAAYDAKIKYYVDHSAVNAVIPLELIEGAQTLTTGQDITSTFPFSDLRAVCDALVRKNGAVIARKSVNADTIIYSQILVANAYCSDTAPSLGLQTIAYMNGALYVVTVSVEGDSAQNKVTVSQVSVVSA